MSAQRSRSTVDDDEFILPLTPNMLLIGRSRSAPCPVNANEEENFHIRKSYVEELEAAWWYQYKVQCFESLLPTRKWVEAKRNLQKGDIVLLQYSSKTVPGTYRLGRIVNIEVDSDDLVRTCTVQYHLCKPDATSASTRKEIRVPTQRIVLILPAEEQ